MCTPNTSASATVSASLCLSSFDPRLNEGQSKARCREKKRACLGPALWGLLGTPSTGKKDSFFRRCHSTMLIKSYTGHSRKKKVTWPIELALVKFVSVCTSVCLCGVLECLRSDPHTPVHTERPERSSVPLHYTWPYSLQSVSLTEPSSQLTPENPPVTA